MHGLFVTGTGTEVGKTYVAALIARELVGQGVRVGVYKPVASGCRRQADGLVSEDAVTLWEAAGRPLSLNAVCPQRFAAPVAPNVAARLVGRAVDNERLRTGVDVWRECSGFVLVEGAGGLMSPLSDEDYNADVARDLGLPIVVVAANRLGVINDTLQTLVTASARGLHVVGVVLNDVAPDGDDSCDTNAPELSRRIDCPLLGRVGWGGGLDRAVDWRRLVSAE